MKDYLSNLIDNGFDFLEKGIDQFRSEPKYSVINFCVAIELFLKARLMKEHWSLIVSHEPNITSFKNGDFKSLNFKDLIPRIEFVTGEKFDKEIIQCFNGLANHRNKMMHFFHEAHLGDQPGKILEKIAIEQCSGWFFLRRLLEKWDDIFENYLEKISQINSMMKEHDIYLDTVFTNIAPEIEAAKKKGAEFKNCDRCKKDSSEVSKLTDYLYSCRCRVCLYTEDLVKVPCQHEDCEGVITIDGYLGGGSSIYCGDCDQAISNEELSELLDTSPRSHDSVDYTTKNCANCGTHAEVIQHEDYYICMNCYYISDDLQVCQWCHDGQIGGGDLEYSGYSGCDFCEGAQGWHKDD